MCGRSRLSAKILRSEGSEFAILRRRSRTARCSRAMCGDFGANGARRSVFDMRRLVRGVRWLDRVIVLGAVDRGSGVLGVTFFGIYLSSGDETASVPAASRDLFIY